jgi:D-glycero-alpha-D-manno-heptose-7-phosphate kinase
MQQDRIREQVQTHVKLTYAMRNHLLRGRLLQFGQSLHEAWQLKRQFSSMITSPALDAIYDDARQHGALGGKLLGAGGGGYFVFYVPPFRKHELIDSLEAGGLKIRPFQFDQHGLQAWSAREGRNHVEAPAP